MDIVKVTGLFCFDQMGLFWLSFVFTVIWSISNCFKDCYLNFIKLSRGAPASVDLWYLNALGNGALKMSILAPQKYKIK